MMIGLREISLLIFFLHCVTGESLIFHSDVRDLLRQRTCRLSIDEATELSLSKVTPTSSTSLSSKVSKNIDRGGSIIGWKDIRKVWFKKNRLQRLIDLMFDETDFNHDGSISFDEAYAGFLLLYIDLNRQAPIPAPPRHIIKAFFMENAIEKNKKGEPVLNREQFGHMLKLTVRRAFFRLSAHKFITLAGAPLLTEYLVRVLSRKKRQLTELTKLLCPIQYQDQVLPTVLSKSFQRSLLIVILVSALGDLVLDVVNYILYTYRPPKQK